MNTKIIYTLNDDFLIIAREIRTTFLGFVVKRKKELYPKPMRYQR